MFRIGTFLFILSHLLSTYGAAEEWPEFRGPTGQGISRATHVPVHWTATSNIAWKVEVPGQGWSSPVVSQGKIFVTSALESKDEQVPLHVICFDAATGKLVWNVEALRAPAREAQKIHSKNSPASPTPIIRDGRVYAHFGHLGTAALDLNGKVLWRQTGIHYQPVHGNGGSPALVDGLLVFSCDGASDPFLAALDAKTGEIRWRTPRHTEARSKFSFATPLEIELDGKKQIISPASGFVGGYDPKSGRELWRVGYGEGYSVVPRPVYAHGLLFLSSGFDRAVVYAINPSGATGDATKNHVAWTIRKGAPTTPSLVVDGEFVYFVSDGGIATCAEAKTGHVRWSERLGGDFSASPIVAEGRIYFVNESGTTTVIRAGPKFEVLSRNELEERCLASPAVVDGTVILRTASHLWRTGEER